MNMQTLDGLLRLRCADLEALHLTHLLSGLDDEDPLAADHCGGVTSLSGYTEWISPDASTLTLGWDWELCSGVGQPHVKRLGLPRTNIQVLDPWQRPLPWEANLQVLAEFIDRIEWSASTFDAICERQTC